MYRLLEHNIQSGSDRIQKLKSKNLYKEFKYKHKELNKISNNRCGMPYIKNNTNKILISKGNIYDCSKNTGCCNKDLYSEGYIDSSSCNLFPHKLNTDNNFYSQKTFKSFDIFKSTGSKINELDNSNNDVNIFNNYENTTCEKEKSLLNKDLNNNIHKRTYLSNKKCNAQIKISSLKLSL
tara:strand:+ start:36 stop:575 length:540 start_codon:yes stop_codon:yes gene_type:complete